MKLRHWNAVGCLLWMWVCVVSSFGAQRPPNVLFILADDLGWADTTLYGHTQLYRTPNVERLARMGMTFSRAYAASPLCSPTRASILTGQTPARTGITTPNCHLQEVILETRVESSARPNQLTLPLKSITRFDTRHRSMVRDFKEHGYATGHFGKWHLGHEPYSPLEHGFDVDVPHWPGPGPAGSYVAPWKFPDFDPDTPNQHIEDRMAQEAVRFMETHRDQPFFLNYWMFSVHAPFDAKKEWIEAYRKQVDPKSAQRSPTYAAMVQSMDDAVGTLLDTLERLELLENTLIVFFSDNGGNMYNEVDGTTPTSNAPLRGGKASMYEGGIRVPCIMTWPGKVRHASRTDALLQSTDFYPTLLDMLGWKAQEGQVFDGISLVPTLLGKPQVHPPILTYFPHNPPVPDWMPPSVALHDGDWKLIRIFHGNPEGGHRWKLFNLRDDLGEKRDLAQKEPERVQAMDAIIEQRLVESGAVLPPRNPALDPAQYNMALEGKAKARNSSTKAADEEFPGLKGWKSRQCRHENREGHVLLKATAVGPFLGVSPGVPGPLTCRFRARFPSTGEGKIEWIPSGTKQGIQAAYQVQHAGQWETMEVPVPRQGPLGIFRIHFPQGMKSMELDWVELVPEKGARKRWDF